MYEGKGGGDEGWKAGHTIAALQCCRFEQRL